MISKCAPNIQCKVSIIIISYNTADLTVECLRSVFRETTSSIEIIVLDNASNDGSARKIAEEFGNKVHLICSQENLGFAGGNNVAAAYATGSYLLLLNPDTVVIDGAIDQLLQFAQRVPGAGIWGGRTIFGDKKLNPGSCWMQQSMWGLTSQALGFTSLFRKVTLFNPEGIGGWNREGVREVDIVCGCFLLIKHTLWKELRGFCPEFFMYGEEADLCLRAIKCGARPIVSSEATIIHYGGASEKILADKLIRLLKAKILLIRRHFPLISRPAGVFLLTCWPLSRYMFYVGSFLLGRRSSKNSMKTWGTVLRRRCEWLD